MAEPELVFSSCTACVVRSRDLSPQAAGDVEATMQENGATISKLKADGTIDFGVVTHVVSATSDFPQYSHACDLMIPVVAPTWIAASLLKNKPAPLRPFSPDPRFIFSGINITCADLPTGDKDAIIGAVLAMGGQDSGSLTKLVTHIVALTEDHPKCQQAREKQLKCKIVLPHWFDDCLKLGKRIDERPYLLPDPEILRKRSDEDLKVPNTTHIEGAMSCRPDLTLPGDTDTPRGSGRRLTVFNEKKIMLAADLGINSRLRGILEDLVEEGGGTITSTVVKADIYVCHFRDGTDYISASRAGKDVGNLAWLYYLIRTNEWTSPLRRLLHYPIPRNGIEGFDKYRITLSNYGGEARIYLENLVLAAGGQFTKSMKEDNTHLITARNSSDKCTAALEWNIAMVNHLWMEESYAKCKVQTITNPKYNHFPPRTNLGEVIGQTQFDEKILEQNYYPQDPAESPERSRQERPVMKTKNNNSAILRTTVTQPLSNESRRSSEVCSDLTNGSVYKSNGAIGAPTPTRPARNVSTPMSNRVGTGKENETPSSTSSRGAKDRAMSKLHDLATDVALYDKEKKRAGGGVWGGKRAADEIEKEIDRKRTSSPTTEDIDDVSDEDDHVNKRIKTGKPPIQVKLLITSYKRWIDEPFKEDLERKKLRNIGVHIVQDPRLCTHLAAPSIVRTQKFLCALASGAEIVSTNFIDACLSGNAMPSVDKFLLKDLQNEKRFKLKLKDIVKRSRLNSRHLLAGVTIYCTPDITNGPETYKAIIEANGGEFGIYSGRKGTEIRRASPGGDDDDEPEAVYLLSSLKPEEKRLWPKFEQMAAVGGFEPRVVHTEWLLDTAMAQEMRWDHSYLAVDG